MPRRHYSPAIMIMMDSWDGGDPFGSAMELAWAIAVVSRAIDHPKPAHILNFRPSPVMREYSLQDLIDGDASEDDNITLPMVDLATAVGMENVSEDDLTFAAKVLHRYIAICEKAGVAY